MTLPVIILGGGGHAKVIMDALVLQHCEILGYTDPDGDKTEMFGIHRLGEDDRIMEYDPQKVLLANGVASVASQALRRQLYDRFKIKGYRFANVTHPSAIVSLHAVLEDGVQIMAGAVIQANSRVCANTIVNTGALIDHDCHIGAHVHIAPGTVLSGNVRVGDESHIGTGAVLIQGVTVGAKSIIGAGAVVVSDVLAGVTVAGVPARMITHSAGE